MQVVEDKRQERCMRNNAFKRPLLCGISKAFHATSDRIEIIESRLGEISSLQKNIGTYSKTKEIYRQYCDSGWNKKFHAMHESDIIIHRTAKKYFDSLGMTKLPSIQSLKQEYASLYAEKRKLYQSYRSEREEMTALLRAKSNVERLLGVSQKPPPISEREVR